MNNIYVVRGTEQAGPFTEAEIRAQLASGALTGDSMVWWEGLPEWTTLSKTPLGAAPAAPAVAAAAPAVVLPATATPNAVVVTPGAAKTSTLAIVSLVLGIIGLLCAPVLGLGAVITGHIARAQISKDPALTGSGLAWAGLILGYLWLALFVVGIIADIMIFKSNPHLLETIQSQINAATNGAPVAPNP